MRIRKPRDSYELMERAIANMEAHPETYLQEQYRISNKEILEALGRSRCEMAFCRAGHISIAYDGILPSTPKEILEKVHGLLGLAGNYSSALFSGGALYHLNGLDGPFARDNNPSFQLNQPEYLRRGIEGMRVFMALHETALRAHKLDTE